VFIEDIVSADRISIHEVELEEIGKLIDASLHQPVNCHLTISRFVF
jgi:hypothetical protein